MNFKKILLVLSSLMLVISGCAKDPNPNQLTKEEKKQGWVLLFDGETSNGWNKVNGQPFPENGKLKMVCSLF